VGFAFAETEGLLLSLGFEEAHYFQNGRPLAYSLSRAS
jgi:histidinol-phosphatase (PHP family)